MLAELVFHVTSVDKPGLLAGLRFKRLELFGRSLFLGLPQVAEDGDGIHVGRHGLSGDVAELLLVRVVLEQTLYHLERDGLGSNASQARNLLSLWTVRVERSELAPRVTEENQEVVGFGFLHFL